MKVISVKEPNENSSEDVEITLKDILRVFLRSKEVRAHESIEVTGI